MPVMPNAYGFNPYDEIVDRMVSKETPYEQERRQTYEARDASHEARADDFYTGGGAGEPRKPFGGAVFTPNPSPVGSTGFGQTLMDIWTARRQIQTDRDTARRDADEQSLRDAQGRGGEGSYTPFPDLYRWSPQGRPAPGIGGTAAPGTAPVRSGQQASGMIDRYRDPHPGADPEAMRRTLEKVQLVPGQQPMDLSSPQKVPMPGINMGMLPSPYVAHGRSGSDMFSGSLAPGVAQGGPFYRPPGAPQGWTPAPGDEAADFEWFHGPGMNPQYRAWITKNQPQNRRMHPLESQLRQFGITPELLVQARSLQGAGRI